MAPVPVIPVIPVIARIPVIRRTAKAGNATGGNEPLHLDRWALDFLGGWGDLVERVHEGTERWDYFNERGYIPLGSSNGYVYTTPPHAEDECHLHRPGLT